MRRILSKIQKINNKIAERCTLIIGTMWCVYAFIILTLLPFFIPSLSKQIQYLSSAFLQLVFLPLIMVGQSILNKGAEKIAKQDHEMIMKELSEIKEIKQIILEMQKGNCD